MNKYDADKTVELAREARRVVLNLIKKTNNSHIGSAFSIIDILTVLYFRILRISADNPYCDERDRFILSKGHSCSALYSVLKLKGFFRDDVLDMFCSDGGCLAGHPIGGSVPGVEATTGSLGHGLSIAVGMALAGKRDNRGYRVFTLVGDGECNEGSIWEAAMFASHHNLDNLVLAVDYNKIQGFGTVQETINLDPLTTKWQAFGWETIEINGHDVGAIYDALSSIPLRTGKPSAIIAHTVKGKGVSFMENQLAWHYKSPNDSEYEQALKELSI
jgi:transketolase